MGVQRSTILARVYRPSRFLLLSRGELADHYLAPQAVLAGRAASSAGGRAAARGARAPLAGAARLFGQAEPVTVAEQAKQPVRLVTEQQLCDASHLLRHLHLVLKS